MIDLSHGHLFSSFFLFWSCYFLFISQRINKIDLYDYFRLEIQIIVSYYIFLFSVYSFILGLISIESSLIHH